MEAGNQPEAAAASFATERTNNHEFIEHCIKRERWYQDERFPEQRHSPQEWSAILRGETDDGMRMYYLFRGDERRVLIRHALRKIAAVVIAIIEAQRVELNHSEGENDPSVMKPMDFIFPRFCEGDGETAEAETYALVFAPEIRPVTIEDWIIQIQSAAHHAHVVLLWDQDLNQWSTIVRTIGLAAGTAMLTHGVEDRTAMTV